MELRRMRDMCVCVFSRKASSVDARHYRFRWTWNELMLLVLSNTRSCWFRYKSSSHCWFQCLSRACVLYREKSKDLPWWLGVAFNPALSLILPLCKHQPKHQLSLAYPSPWSFLEPLPQRKSLHADYLPSPRSTSSMFNKINILYSPLSLSFDVEPAGCLVLL